MAIRWFGTLVVLVSVLFSAISNLAADHCAIVPSKWRPSLDQTDKLTQEEFRTGGDKSQQALNLWNQSRAELRDAQLFITYVLFAQSLDEKGRAELFDEQNQWLAAREKSARAAVLSKGGTLEPLEYSGALRRITEKRLADLERRLARQTGAKTGDRNRSER